MAILKGSTLLSRARAYADDSVAPYYVSDEEMYTWITEAERQLAAAGKLIRDVSTYTVDDDANSRWVNQRKTAEVLEFRSAVLVDSNSVRYPLGLKGSMDEPIAVYNEIDYGNVYSARNLTPGKPQVLIFGKKTGYFELSPPSSTDYTIEASVVLYPTCPIEFAADEPSIPERYHTYIPIGAALMSMQGAEDEQLGGRIARLEAQWNTGLNRAQVEASSLDRDAGPVYFINDMWAE